MRPSCRTLGLPATPTPTGRFSDSAAVQRKHAGAGPDYRIPPYEPVDFVFWWVAAFIALIKLCFHPAPGRRECAGSGFGVDRKPLAAFARTRAPGPLVVLDARL